MKKSLFVLGGLLVLAVGLLLMAHSTLNGARDRVTMQETVLAGDRSAARGVTLTSRVADYTNRLFWATSFQPAQESLALETAFDFFIQTQERNISQEPHAALDIAGLNFGIGSSGNIDFEEYGTRAWMYLPAADVASRTKPGEERVEDVYLKDYYDYYLLSLEFGKDALDYDSASVDGHTELLSEYFAIEVAPEHRLEVTTYRDEAGNLTDVNCATPYEGDPRIYTDVVMSADGLYAYISTHSWDGEPIDLIRCADGQGIWFIPFESGGKGDLAAAAEIARVDSISMVYPLEGVSARDMELRLSEDEEKLLLYAFADGRLTLTVLEIGTWITLQEITLLEAGEDRMLYKVLEGDGFQVAVLDDWSFALVRENGTFGVGLTGQLDGEWGGSLIDGAQLAWDGERLVWACYHTRYEDSFALVTYLAVWDKAGVAFAARYDHSIWRDPSTRSSYQYYPDAAGMLLGAA